MGPSCKRAIASAWAALLLFAATGCDTDPVSIAIRDAEGKTPAFYRVIAESDEGPPYRVTCSGSAAEDRALSCTSDGVRLRTPSRRVSLVIKAPGNRFAEIQKQWSGDLAGADRRMEVALVPLAPFEENADFATGFGADGGLDRFMALARPADTEIGPAYAVKFYIADPDGEGRVYFQNTVKHALHYDFAREVLGLPLSRAEFDRETYWAEDRAALAGTLVYYPRLSASCRVCGAPLTAPVALTFFPSDDLTAAQVLGAHRRIEERLGFASLDGAALRLVYLPAASGQEADAANSAGRFAANDALWITWQEALGSLELQILNAGLAYGTLRILDPEALASTVVSFQDILVLTRLPNSLPIVGGTITAEQQTPLAHVNVAARARGTPNIAWRDADLRPEVTALAGRWVRFEVAGGDFSLTGSTQAEAEAFWQSRAPERFAPPFDADPDRLAPFDDLGFDDAISVGAKAANLAEIHRVLPEESPNGFAVPFHYYDAFLRSAAVTGALADAARVDCAAEGRDGTLCDRARTLCGPPGKAAEILLDHVSRLLAIPEVQSDSALREACLDNLRFYIRNTPVDPAFGAALDARVAELFGSGKVRLRSSTNAEDLPGFSGAGLYSSVSAYASGEKAASSRIRRVWASVWNWSAFEERSFWNIDHLAVRMGVAVHQAFTEEAANGVLITRNIADPLVDGFYVNVQSGEVPVTNPEDGALPEIFTIVPGPAGAEVLRQRFSSLSPDAPILTRSEVSALYRAAAMLVRHFAPLYGVDPGRLALEIEFKFEGPERALVIKQARPYAESGTQGVPSEGGTVR